MFLLAIALSRCLAVGAMKPELGRGGVGLEEESVFVGLAGFGVFDGGHVAMS